MAIYYVDGDNSPKERIRGIEWLRETDTVRIYYACNNTFYPLQKNQKQIECQTKAKVQFISVPAGKNAVDFAVAVNVSISIANGEKELIFLVSEDSDFQMITNLICEETRAIGQVEKVKNIWQGLLQDSASITNLKILEKILQEQFGDDEGKNLLFKAKELIELETQEIEEKKISNRRKRRGLIWGLIRKNNLQSGKKCME